MRGSLRIGKIAGIPIGIHWSFLLLVAYVVLVSTGGDGINYSIAGQNLLLLAGVFACVLLHELGHGFAAMRFGIRTRFITLLPFGGAARLEREPEGTRQEISVSLAGPVVNLIIAAAIFTGLLLTARETWSGGYTFSLQRATDLLLLREFPATVAEALLVMNVILFLFNMLPAYPLDGGRIFRALLSVKLSRLRATQVAVRTGQLFALGFLGLGLYTQDVVLSIVGALMFMSAGSELEVIRGREMIARFNCGEAMLTSVHRFCVWDTTAEAFEVMKSAGIREAMVTQDGRITGVIHQGHILHAVAKGMEDQLLCKIMIPDAPRIPATASLDDAVKKMEKLRAFMLLVIDESDQVLGLLSWDRIREFAQMQHSIQKQPAASAAGNIQP